MPENLTLFRIRFEMSNSDYQQSEAFLSFKTWNEAKQLTRRHAEHIKRSKIPLHGSAAGCESQLRFAIETVVNPIHRLRDLQ